MASFRLPKLSNTCSRHIIAVAAVFIVAAIFAYWGADVNSQTIDFRTSQEVKEINQEIKTREEIIEELQEQANQYAQTIQNKQAEANSLENELDIIANRIAKLEIDIERKNNEIERSNLKIKETDLEIKEKESEINFQKIQLASLLREIHRQDSRSRLEILINNDSLSDFFSYVRQLEDVQSNMQVTLAGIKETKRELEIDEHALEKEKEELQKLLLEIEIEKQKFEEEKSGKERLIEETKLSESNYQKLLGEIRHQQRVANEEIRELEAEVKRKLQQAQLRNPNIVINPGQLLWPIQNQGITTYFHDPTYPFRHIVGEHSGLDLRTLVNGIPTMGLRVRAPSGGIVVKTIPNGRFTGNAIFLSHGDVLTTYYHLSEIWVEPDQLVNPGDTIGLTGGSPGHPGAGLSSGPHLHFEVRQNGIPVDPCGFLTPSC